MDSTEPQQRLDGDMPKAPHMLARVNALAIKLVFPFISKDDIRFYLCGVNIRPLADNAGVMVVATDGHRYIVVRDPQGYAEREMIVAVMKDGIKHCNAKTTFDVMSNGTAMIQDIGVIPQFIQPNNSLIDGDFPKIENVASIAGYKEGISGAVNPAYLADAIEAAAQFGSIRFFSKDADSPLCFVFGGIGELDCFGGIAKLRDSFDGLPQWFPKRVAPNTLAEM